MNIFNFANRQLCEYQSIFPTVASLLDHLLFTNGNGYDYDTKRGMIYEHNGKKKVFIDQVPALSDLDWKKLIAKCHEKEHKFHLQYHREPTDESLAQLKEDCAKYRRISVDAEMFSESGLYQQLRDMRRAKETEAFEHDRDHSFVRPYPLSPGYAEIFSLNENTPGWFLQIAYNLCNAWVQFLNEEIEYNNVWIKPSLRPKRAGHEIRSAAMAELFAMIKEDAGYDGWLDKEHKEPESDYADLAYTTKHRDMLTEQAQRIGQLMIDSSGFAVGDKVKVKIRDPFYTYAGSAEPMPGMEAVVSDIAITEPKAFGKIAFTFVPEVLGYESREDDDSITLYLRPWIMERV